MNPIDKATWAICDRPASLPVFPAIVASFIAATILMVGAGEGMPQ